MRVVLLMSSRHEYILDGMLSYVNFTMTQVAAMKRFSENAL
jgi:hypothetical protein